VSNKIVEIQNVTKSFVMESETVHALKGISFSIEEGEFILSWAAVDLEKRPC
jgi:putative ABC transport system ATP-binding protein